MTDQSPAAYRLRWLVLGLFGFAVIVASAYLGVMAFSFFTAVFFAYLLVPIANFLETKGLSPSWASAVIVMAGLFVVAAITGVFAPLLYGQMERTVAQLPKIIDPVFSYGENLLERLGYEIPLEKNRALHFVQRWGRDFLDSFLGPFSAFARSAINNLVSLVLIIVNIFLVPFFLFLLLRCRSSIRREFMSLFPLQRQGRVLAYGRKIDQILASYLRGQVLACSLVGCAYGAGFTIIGVPSGFAMGLVAGVLNVVPYLGPATGIGIAGIVALAHSSEWSIYLGILVIHVIVQTLEGMLITPYVMGQKVALDPLLVVLAVIIGGNMLGMAGMLIAIPCAAILKMIYFDLKELIGARTSILVSQKQESKSRPRHDVQVEAVVDSN